MGRSTKSGGRIFQIPDDESRPDVLKPRVLSLAIAVQAPGLRWSASCDADLRDKRVRIERSGADLKWVTVAGGDAMLDRVSLDPDFTVEATPQRGGSELAADAQEAAPASRGALSLYRMVVGARWPLRGPTRACPNPVLPPPGILEVATATFPRQPCITW